MKIIKEDINNMQSVINPIDGIQPTVDIPPVMAAAITDSKNTVDKIKKVLKDADAEVKDKPFTGTEKERETIIPKTQDLKDMKLVESTITESNEEYWQIHDRTSELLDMLFAYLRETQGEKEFINFAKTQLNMTDRELHYYCDIDLNELDELDELDETYTNGLGNKTLKESMHSVHIEIPANREAYGIYDIEDTATAGELASYFSDLSEDTKVYLNHDNGYTYGSLDINYFEEVEDEYGDDTLEESTQSNPIADVKKDIARAQKKLNGKAPSENFGQAEVRKLKDKYAEFRYGPNREVFTLINNFDEWCQTYTGPKNESIKNNKKPMKEGFHTYKSLWEEIMYRLDNAASQQGRPPAGKFSSVDEIGIDFSRLDGPAPNYYGITALVNTEEQLTFAEDLCKEYDIEKIPYENRTNHQTTKPGFYCVNEFTSRYAPAKYKIFIFIDIKEKGQHHGFKSTSNVKDKEEKELVGA